MLGKPRGQADALGRLGCTSQKAVPPEDDTARSRRPSSNLLATAGPPAAPGAQILSDITYIPTREGWLYLAIVIDLFSRSILGWKLSESLHTQVVAGALRCALDTGLVGDNAIFHSDRGCQHCAAHTRELLARHGLRQSMSAAGYCYDNTFAESAFASLKAELPDDGQPFDSKQAAMTAIFDYLETFYNKKRRRSALGYQSPQAFLNQYFVPKCQLRNAGGRRKGGNTRPVKYPRLTDGWFHDAVEMHRILSADDHDFVAWERAAATRDRGFLPAAM